MAVAQNTTVGTEVNRPLVAKATSTIPRDVQLGLIALALLQGRLRETHQAIDKWRKRAEDQMGLIALALLHGELRETREAIDKWEKRVEDRMPGSAKFASETTLVADLIHRHNKRCTQRASTKPASWPAGELVPRNYEQAIQQGWELAGRERTIREDDFQGLYEARLQKTVGPLRLALTLPYRVNLTYGRPHGPRRVIQRGAR